MKDFNRCIKLKVCFKNKARKHYNIDDKIFTKPKKTMVYIYIHNTRIYTHNNVFKSNRAIEHTMYGYI